MMLFLAVLLTILGVVTPAWADSFQVGKHISSQTTTTLQAAVSGKRIYVNYLSACVDAAGATTSITIQDSASTNLFGTSVVWAIPAGACLTFDLRPPGAGNGYWGAPTAAGASLQIVTGTGNGPIEINVEGIQQ